MAKNNFGRVVLKIGKKGIWGIHMEENNWSLPHKNKLCKKKNYIKQKTMRESEKL